MFASFSLMRRAPGKSTAATSFASARWRPPPSDSARSAAEDFVRAAERGAEALGHLAALPGVHRVHRVAAAHVAPRRRRAHPRPHLARLPRDAVRGRRPPGRSGAARRRWRRTPASTSASSKARFRPRTDGIYCMIGGPHRDRDPQRRGRRRPAPIIAIGSCASWGGVPSADPNPTGAVGAPPILKGKTGRQRSPAVPPTPTTSSARSCSTRPRHAAGPRRRSAGRCSPTAAPSTSTARGARTSTPAASPRSSATKAIARATASTSSDARVR